MARRLRSSTLETRTARAKLPISKRPLYIQIAPGISLGYRRNESAGTWSVRAADGKGSSWLKRIAYADDHEDSDGGAVLDFWEATERAKALARGKDADAGRPATVGEALNDYADDLAVRGANPGNASHPRFHLTPALLSKPVSLLSVRELRTWRNTLAKTMKAATVNRLNKALKAALNLAASHDERIHNAKAWTTGLAALPEADDVTSNLVLSDKQRRDVIAAAHAISPAFGLYVETHDATGARSGQIALLDVGDLTTGAAPLLQMPSSLKGKNRRTRSRKPIPITAALAKRLKQAALGRPASAPLLLNGGGRWNALKHRLPFMAAAQAAGLPDHATIYSLRHSAITRTLLRGVPVRLVASSFDTSVAMIEKTYSKHIANFGDDLMRAALCPVED